MADKGTEQEERYKLCKCNHQKDLHSIQNTSLSPCRGYADIDIPCPCMRFVESGTVKSRCLECNEVKGIGYFIDYDPPSNEYVCRSCYMKKIRATRKFY